MKRFGLTGLIVGAAAGTIVSLTSTFNATGVLSMPGRIVTAVVALIEHGDWEGPRREVFVVVNILFYAFGGALFALLVGGYRQKVRHPATSLPECVSAG